MKLDYDQIKRIMCLLSILVGVSTAHAQEDCRCAPQLLPDDEMRIYHWSAWDTCGTNLDGGDCRNAVLQMTNDELLDRLYGRGPWIMQFKDSTFLVPRAPSGSLVYVDWRDINPRYSALKLALGDVEQRFGIIQLEKRVPELDTGRASQLYSLRFQITGTVHALSADTALASLPDIQFSHRQFGSYFLESVERSDESTTELSVTVANDMGSIIVSVPSNNNIRSAFLLNSLGDIVSEFDINAASTTTVNVGHLASGVYFILSKSSVRKFYITR